MYLKIHIDIFGGLAIVCQYDIWDIQSL